jgi:hypothetical protein
MKCLLLLSAIGLAFIPIMRAPAASHERAIIQRSRRAAPKKAKRQPSDAELEAVIAKCNLGAVDRLAYNVGRPTYPKELRKEPIAGTVLVRVYFNGNGKVYYAHAESGPDPLRQSAVAAAYTVFFPKIAIADVMQKKCSGTLSFNFVL